MTIIADALRLEELVARAAGLWEDVESWLVNVVAIGPAGRLRDASGSAVTGSLTLLARPRSTASVLAKPRLRSPPRKTASTCLSSPTLGCRADLTRERDRHGELIAVEHIVADPQQHCVDNGEISITRERGMSFHWRWRYPDSGEEGADAELTRVVPETHHVERR